MATSLAVFRFGDDGEILEQDIHLDANGDLALKSGLDELRERVICRLQMFRGEDIFDRTQGLPLTNRILQRPFSEGLAASVISAEILQIEEVTAVEEVEVSVKQRLLSYVSARIRSIFGELTVSVG